MRSTLLFKPKDAKKGVQLWSFGKLDRVLKSLDEARRMKKSAFTLISMSYTVFASIQPKKAGKARRACLVYSTS